MLVMFPSKAWLLSSPVMIPGMTSFLGTGQGHRAKTRHSQGHRCSCVEDMGLAAVCCMHMLYDCLAAGLSKIDCNSTRVGCLESLSAFVKAGTRRDGSLIDRDSVPARCRVSPSANTAP